MCNAFASFFSSVYDEDNLGNCNYPESDMCEVSEVFFIKQVSYEDVCDAVRSLKINKAVGPDNIPSYIFKGLVGFLAEPLNTRKSVISI